MSVLAEPDNELSLTVGRAWLELWGGRMTRSSGCVRSLTPVTSSRARLEEAAGSQIMIHPRIGILGGGQVRFLP